MRLFKALAPYVFALSILGSVIWAASPRTEGPTIIADTGKFGAIDSGVANLGLVNVTGGLASSTQDAGDAFTLDGTMTARGGNINDSPRQTHTIGCPYNTNEFNDVCTKEVDTTLIRCPVEQCFAAGTGAGGGLQIQGNESSGPTAVAVELRNRTTLTSGMLMTTSNAGVVMMESDFQGNTMTQRATNPDGGFRKFPVVQNPVKAQQGIVFDVVTLAAGDAGYTFTEAFSATPICVCNDKTAKLPVTCNPTTTAMIASGTGTDVIAFACMGAM